MIELPEATTLAQQINLSLVGKSIQAAIAAQSPHKFAWYNGDPADYPAILEDANLQSARGLGMYVEITLSNGFLLFNDGVNLRFHPTAGPIPAKHQLLINFSDGTSLSASVAMYGGVVCWEKSATYDNTYYQTALSKPSPLTNAFDFAYFQSLIAPPNVQKLPLKAVLATEQRIPGLGNGCLQDILWVAQLHPRRKLNTLAEDEVRRLFSSTKDTLKAMTEQGGRSTEKDLYGQAGGYQVHMSAVTNGKPCPRCGAEIKKEAYLGGSIYTCPNCQKL